MARQSDRDTASPFHTDWVGEIPPKPNAAEIRAIVRMQNTESQGRAAHETILTAYHNSYFNVGRKSYHRRCGGGAVIMTERGPECARCGLLHGTEDFVGDDTPELQ